MLSVLDRKWREHLYEMDYLKEGIGLRAMAQRDPLVEYQREGFDMFAAMLDSLKEESVGFLYNLQVQVVPAGEQAQPAAAADGAPVVTAASAAATAIAGAAGRTAPPRLPHRPRPPQHRSGAGSGRWRRCPPSRRRRRHGRRDRRRTRCAARQGPRRTDVDSAADLQRPAGGRRHGDQARPAAAPAKQGTATATGSKEPGRNAPCPCGSGQEVQALPRAAGRTVMTGSHSFDQGRLDPRREGDRLPRGDAAQGIDHWAEHGVVEMAARDAAERAELGEPDPRRPDA